MNLNCKAKVCAYTLGCKVNQYDTSAMLEILNNDGFEIVEWGDYADIFLINTCTVTNTADKKSRNAIAQARRVNSDAKIILAGCMAQLSGEDFLKKENIKAVITTNNRSKISDAAKVCLDELAKDEIKNQSADEFESLYITMPRDRTRAFIKVQEGCANFCTYCIIPYVRGAPRSRELKDAVNEAVILSDNGVKEVVITGINLTSYKDKQNHSFVDLVSQIADRVFPARVRLGSLDVYNLDDDDLLRLSVVPNLCPHFHISLQSGSDEVLKRMGRKYTSSEFLGYIDKIRYYWDNPAITTDIITGFPKETEKEFNETVKFVEKVKFSRLHIFPYSERTGTAAEKMTGAIPKAVRKDRAKILIDIGQLSERNYIDSIIGKSATILIERKNENGYIGYTERYIETVCQNGNLGEFQKARIVKRKENVAYAE